MSQNEEVYEKTKKPEILGVRGERRVSKRSTMSKTSDFYDKSYKYEMLGVRGERRVSNNSTFWL